MHGPLNVKYPVMIIYTYACPAHILPLFLGIERNCRTSRTFMIYFRLSILANNFYKSACFTESIFTLVN